MKDDLPNLCVFKTIGFLGELKDLLSISSFSKFDLDILLVVDNAISSDEAQTLKLQIEKIHRMRRIINIGKRGFIHFTFRKESLRSKGMQFFLKLKAKRKLCSLRAICVDGNAIEITVVIFNGLLFKIDFYSKKGQCYPKSDYYFDSVVAFPAGIMSASTV